ncbi:phosphotransferase enzyme family protein [Flexivirga caeni]|uniref:Aminoglycoside phosphotransferase family protein n=1 Tax=Flexivirga caeni TaxID=2294115 RepID=A0A3M9M8J3_9MICO|nr:aminoglycoside phosphotransferase family protein [Flexivirga caeni]RNI21517.1 aminoglycoside phosphotransferase family protein [Flexivirga caeni]
MTIRDAGENSTTAHWLAETFSLGRALDLKRVARGAMGEVCQLITTSGRYAAKRYYWPDGLPHAEFSEVFAERCRGLGVPVPEVHRDRSGALLVQAKGGAWWQLADWVSGSKPVAGDADSARWLVRQTARIHSIGQRPDWDAHLDPFYASCAVDWSALAARARCAGADWAGQLTERVEEFTQLGAWASSVPVGELRISHNDLTLDNVLVSGGSRWLIDWDNVGPQDPIRELGVQLAAVLSDPDLVRDLVRIYCAAGGAEFRWSEGIFASAFVIRLNYLAVQIETLLDAAQLEHHDFARTQVVPLLRDVPSMSGLDEQLAAVELP